MVSLPYTFKINSFRDNLKLVEKWRFYESFYNLVGNEKLQLAFKNGYYCGINVQFRAILYFVGFVQADHISLLNYHYAYRFTQFRYHVFFLIVVPWNTRKMVGDPETSGDPAFFGNVALSIAIGNHLNVITYFLKFHN